MWKQIADILKWIITISEETRRNRSDIEKLQQETRQINADLERMSYEIQLLRETQKRDHDNLVLQLDNVLLQF